MLKALRKQVRHVGWPCILGGHWPSSSADLSNLHLAAINPNYYGPWTAPEVLVAKDSPAATSAKDRHLLSRLISANGSNRTWKGTVLRSSQTLHISTIYTVHTNKVFRNSRDNLLLFNTACFRFTTSSKILATSHLKWRNKRLTVTFLHNPRSAFVRISFTNQRLPSFFSSPENLLCLCNDCCNFLHPKSTLPLK